MNSTNNNYTLNNTDDIHFGSTIHECAFGGALMFPGVILVSNFIWSCFHIPFEYGKPGTYSLNICQNLRSNGWLRSGIIPLIVAIALIVIGIVRKNRQRFTLKVNKKQNKERRNKQYDKEKYDIPIYFNCIPV